MSLFGALSASLTALTAQSAAVNVISNNISNLSAAGFKSTTTSFSTLIAGSVGGGVLQGLRNDIDKQGAISSTNVGTDLAVQGAGFFTVNDIAGKTLYTRAGSFRTDKDGNLVNEAGYQLMGWRLDSQGRIPGEEGNITNTTASNDVRSLSKVSTKSITGIATPTSQIVVKANLRAEEPVIRGASATVSLQSTANANNTANDLIIPASFANSDTVSVTVNNDGTATTTTYRYGGVEASNNVTSGSGIGGATTETAIFTSFTDGQSFTIQTDSMDDPVTLTFKTSSNTNLKEFKNMKELATILNAIDGVRARIQSGIIYVAADDANNGITFANVTGTLTTSLGFSNMAADTNSNRFATLGNLADIINSEKGEIAAEVVNPTGDSSLTIYNIDPTGTLQFADTISGTDSNQMLTEFDLDTDAIDEVYDAEGLGGNNMASGLIAPSFSRTVTIYDSLGRSLDMRLSFVKLASDSSEIKWGVELYAIDPNAIESSRDDGLVAYGTVNFNGDGTLSSINGPSTGAIASIGGDISVQAKGASEGTITVNLGTAGELGIGKSDGLSQFAGAYTSDVTQNGFPTGQLQSLQIDAQGYVTAIFDNSLTSKVYRLPLATFANPNALTAEAGNAYSANNSSGSQQFGKVGDASVGTIVPGAVEVSTAEIGQQLTNLIVSQQAYSASTNVLRKVSDLFEELKNL